MEFQSKTAYPCKIFLSKTNYNAVNAQQNNARKVAAVTGQQLDWQNVTVLLTDTHD